MRHRTYRRTQYRRSSFFASLGIIVLVALAALTWGSGRDTPADSVRAQGVNYALRLYGNGVAAPGQDRVRIPIDAPPRPADLGATDFTIEFWLKALSGGNNGVAACGANDGWITANTVIDRDIFGGGDYGDFGIAVSGGNVIAFGLSVGASGTTLCSSQTVGDGRWHHVAAVRRLDGFMQLFVDGQPAGSTQGATGNASYRDNRNTTNPVDSYLVFGAEKHDVGAAYPSFNGWIDEVRLSSTARYTAAFIPSTIPFIADGATVGLYHFDEGPVGACTGVVRDASGAVGGPSDGVCVYGGLSAGPQYVTDTPFGAVPPTATNTPPAPTVTNTPPAPTVTNTPPAPTVTNTPPAPTVTNTPPAPTVTNTPPAPTVTNTPPAPTVTNTPPAPTVTNTPPAPTVTNTPPAPTVTNTPPAPTVTNTPPAPTVTNTPTATTWPIVISTPGGTIPPVETGTPAGQETPAMTPTLPPCPTTTWTLSAAPDDAQDLPEWRLYLPFVQQEPPCATNTP
jgi:hypothetical protein